MDIELRGVRIQLVYEGKETHPQMPLRASMSRRRPDDGGDMAAAAWSLYASN